MWRCSNCGEQLDDHFQMCWNCGTTADGTPSTSFERDPGVPSISGPSPDPDVDEELEAWPDTPGNASTVGLWLLVCLQCVLVVILLFGDIGFDHPGRFGLSFGHSVCIVVAYLLAITLGFVFAVRNRAWEVLLAQVLLPLAILALTSILTSL